MVGEWRKSLFATCQVGAMCMQYFFQLHAVFLPIACSISSECTGHILCSEFSTLQCNTSHQCIVGCFFIFWAARVLPRPAAEHWIQHLLNNSPTPAARVVSLWKMLKTAKTDKFGQTAINRVINLLSMTIQCCILVSALVMLKNDLAENIFPFKGFLLYHLAADSKKVKVIESESNSSFPKPGQRQTSDKSTNNNVQFWTFIHQRWSFMITTTASFPTNATPGANFAINTFQ